MMRTNAKWDSLDHIQELLNRSDDPILVILRGHLILETYLRDILEVVCRAPEELEEGERLTFHQLLSLIRAIVGRENDSVWDFIERLNTVRNKIAHHLEPGDLDAMIIAMVERLWAHLPGLIDKERATPLSHFRRAVFYAFGYLHSIRGSVHLRQAYEPPPPGGV